MKRVLLAMSGGYDSSVAAKILLEQGYSVVGLTLKLTDDFSADYTAKSTAEQLAIEHIVLDVTERFNNEVIERFASDYLAGLTPNPCQICNRRIKFGLLYDYAMSHHFDYLATGHHAKIVRFKRRLAVAKSDITRRDQSYFLYHLTAQQLQHLLLPLAPFTSKGPIIKRYQQTFAALPTKVDSESVGVCFTQHSHYGDWIDRHYATQNKGIVRDLTGKIRGSHQGFYHYTIGQKNIAQCQMTKSECVIAVKPQLNEVIIGDETHCYHRSVELDETNFHSFVSEGMPLTVKIFNWGYYLAAKIIERRGQSALLRFDAPVRAIAPGQYAVAYLNDVVVGGGRIVRAFD